jgi:hypothetical protein
MLLLLEESLVETFQGLISVLINAWRQLSQEDQSFALPRFRFSPEPNGPFGVLAVSPERGMWNITPSVCS